VLKSGPIKKMNRYRCCNMTRIEESHGVGTAADNSFADKSDEVLS
jgi:hypothetical protein